MKIVLEWSYGGVAQTHTADNLAELTEVLTNIAEEKGIDISTNEGIDELNDYLTILDTDNDYCTTEYLVATREDDEHEQE